MRGVMRGAVATLLVVALLSGCLQEKDDPETDSDGASSTTVRPGSGTGSATRGSTAPGSTGGPTGNETSANQAPTAAIEANATSGAAPLNVTFALDAGDADGDALQWVVYVANATQGDTTANATGNETDGAPGTEVGRGAFTGANGTYAPANFTHTFTAPGNFTVTLLVSDGRDEARASTNVTVSSGADPAAPAETSEDAWAVFNADGTCDAKGEFALPGGMYVHERGDPPGTGFANGDGTWVYEESNGIAGLQVGGAAESGAYVNCANPDHLVF